MSLKDNVLTLVGYFPDQSGADYYLMLWGDSNYPAKPRDLNAILNDLEEAGLAQPTRADGRTRHWCLTPRPTHTYLITPKYSLGSDSFYIKAQSHAEAIEQAKKRIKEENWHSANGWNVLLEATTFEDDNA